MKSLWPLLISKEVEMKKIGENTFVVSAGEVVTLKLLPDQCEPAGFVEVDGKSLVVHSEPSTTVQFPITASPGESHWMTIQSVFPPNTPGAAGLATAFIGSMSGEVFYGPTIRPNLADSVGIEFRVGGGGGEGLFLEPPGKWPNA